MAQEPSPEGQKREKPGYDQALKRLLSRAHNDFLSLVAPGYTWRSDLSPELPAVARQADIVWEVTDSAGERGILHVELQTRPDKNMGERVTEYAIRLWLREHLPLRSVIVFLRPATTLPSSPFFIRWSGEETLRYSFDVVKLWEFPAQRVLARTAYELWPLAAVMGDVSVQGTVEIAERIAATPLSQHERGELTALLVALSELRLTRGAVRDALRRHPLIDNLLRESSLAEEFIVEGERRMAQRMAHIVLEARFGTLPEDVLTSLHSADQATLQDVVAQAVANQPLERIRERLGLS